MCLDKQYKSRGRIYKIGSGSAVHPADFSNVFFTLLLLRPWDADSCVAGNLWSLLPASLTICLGFVCFFPAGISSWWVRLLARIHLFHVKCACGEVPTSRQNMHKGGRTYRRFSICPEGLSNLSTEALLFSEALLCRCEQLITYPGNAVVMTSRAARYIKKSFLRNTEQLFSVPLHSWIAVISCLATSDPY